MEGDIMAFEEIAVNGNVTALNSDIYAPADGAQGAKAVITVEGGDMRYRLDGQDPTIDSGHLLRDGAVLELKSIYSIRKFRVINTTETAGKLSVSYES